jgi:Ca2+-binding RTX toxin-like protein
MTSRLLAVALLVSMAVGAGSAVQVRGQSAPRCGAFAATVIGTPGDDVLTGTARHEVIVGLDGDDTILGRGGGDWICGNAGNDTLSTQDRQRDPMVVVYGGPGDDTITLTGAGDTLHRAFGGAGNDRIDCGHATYSFVDFRSATAPLRVNLAAGTATGEGVDVLLNCKGAGGARFDDELIGSAERNWFTGGGGADRIVAGAGNDSLYGNEGNDILDGGAGVDSISFGGATRVAVNLSRGRASGEGNDRLRRLENVEGTRGPDVLIGNATANVLRGWLGNDRLVGGGGNDRLVGSDGRDFVDGGTGRDSCRGEVLRRCP